MLTLLIAAIGKQKRDQCKDYSIKIKGARKSFFVDDKAIIEDPGACRKRQDQRTEKISFQSAGDRIAAEE